MRAIVPISILHANGRRRRGHRSRRIQGAGRCTRRGARYRACGGGRGRHRTACGGAVPVTEPVPSLVWAVQDPARHWLADLAFWWGRCAQPAVFFMLAGLFAAHSRATRSAREYAQRRIERLGVALVGGTLLVLPIVAAVWAWGWISTRRTSLAEIAAWRFTDAALQANRFGPAHLWFIQDLLILSAMFALVPLRWLNRVARITATRSALAILTAASLAILIADVGAVLDLRNTFVPNGSRLLYGATFFAGGVLLAGHSTRARALMASRAASLLPAAAFLAGAAVAGAGVAALVSSEVDGQQRLASGRGWSRLRVVQHSRSHARCRLPSCFDRSAAARHLAAVSLPVYLVHLPIVGFCKSCCSRRLCPR